ncbi:MAG: C4-dicarboxylate TRAP transporter substrate-binding protein [Rhodobiaceae bacterium]|nr:C4-dicarboxylate TRAP transporter substrate-binding protein [Rhodobiaceae bacterium]MCC0054597.1 C4-dicarboxylate TRAP transporter substrate-binding protein [Rhodobiaceae bacterium]
MKKAVLMGLALAAGLSVSAKADNVNIVYAAYGAPTSTLVANGIIPFLDEAKKRGNGTIDYTLHSGGSLAGAKAMLGAVKDGVADGGQILGVYFPGDLAYSNLASGVSPALNVDARASVAAWTEFVLLHCPKCRKEHEDNNIQFLGGYATAPYVLLCREPAKSLADLKGKKIRASGDWGFQAQRLGMTPVNMGIGETYESLQRGTVDCTFGAVGWLESFSMGDVAKNVVMTTTGVSYSGPILDLRKDLWDTLTDEQKQAFKEAAAVGIISAGQGYLDDDKKVLAQAKDKGWNLIEPDQDVKDALAGFPADMAKIIVEKGKERGMADAQEIIDGMAKMLEKWQAIVKEHGDDNEAISKVVMTEIYDKM